jgi:hypothetical protein
MRNFLGFARSFIIRRNPIKAFLNDCLLLLKDTLSIKQKQKLARYRLGYQVHKLNELEGLIAQSNEHSFLKGSKFNEMR